jgi:hypothetical protein
MNVSAIIQETGLWEAWIEFDPLNSKGFGTLYILGEAPVNRKSKNQGIKKIGVGNTSFLVLSIPEVKGPGRFTNKEVLYYEPIVKIDQYKHIVVYQGEELLAEIHDIEVLI